MKKKVISIIMGGGRGTRLYPLTKLRCKPAVPLGGKYRLVDIPISNCLNSGLNQIYVLTQFNTASLHRHIQESYKFDPFGGGFVDILSAEQTERGEKWYQGTADAVRQNLSHFRAGPDDLFLILSGDQLYRMELHELIEQHKRTKADITIAAKAMPSDAVQGLGVMRIADDQSITEFVEKPKDPAVIDSLVIPDALQSKIPNLDPGKYCLANMGIYCFSAKALYAALAKESMTDFGKEVIPSLLGKVGMYSYMFNGYWEDIGTVRSFFDANLSLADFNAPFNFFEPGRVVYTHARYLPASRVLGCHIDHALIADGCVIYDSKIHRSSIGVRSIVRAKTELDNVVMMGADIFEKQSDEVDNASVNRPNLGVGKRCKIRQAIIDKNARIGDDVILDPTGKPDGWEEGDVYVRDGILLVLKDGVVPNGTKIRP